MEYYEPETEIEENIENLYNIFILNEEYELSMKINNSLLEFKLQKKSNIVDYYYNSKYDLKKINAISSISFKKIKEAFDLFDNQFKDKIAKLVKFEGKNIINIKFKIEEQFGGVNEIIFELKEIKLSKDEIHFLLIKEMNFLMKNMNVKIKEKEKELINLKNEINQLKKEQEKKIDSLHILIQKKIFEIENNLMPILKEFQEKKQKEINELSEYENLINDFKIIYYKHNNPNKNTEKDVFYSLDKYMEIFKINKPKIETNKNELDLSNDIIKIYKIL